MAQTRYRRAALIFNPTAGRGFYQPAKPVDQVTEALGTHVDQVLLLPTTSERRAEAQAREGLEKGCDLIAPLGGDGTINEALQAVAGSDATMLPLAAGTANVFARETGMGLNPVETAAALPKLEERAVQLGVVQFLTEGTERLFLLMCGAGVDAKAVYDVNAGFKQQVGILAYVWSGLKQLTQPVSAITAQLGDENWTGGLIVISKSRLYGGGLILTPGAHLLADRFDIVGFGSQSPLEYTGYLAAVATRTVGKLKGVTHRQLAMVEVMAAENSAGVYVQVDGELAGTLPVRVRMGPENVRLLAPSTYWSRVRKPG